MLDSSPHLFTAVFARIRNRQPRVGRLETELLVPPSTSTPVCSSFGFQPQLSKRHLSLLQFLRAETPHGLTSNPLLFDTHIRLIRKACGLDLGVYPAPDPCSRPPELRTWFVSPSPAPPASSDDRITASLSASTLPSTVYWPPTSRGFRRQVRSSHCCAQSPIIQGKPNASSLRPGSLSPARPHPPPASLSHPQSSPVGLPVGGVLPQGLRSVLGGVFLGPGTHLPHCLLCAQ